MIQEMPKLHNDDNQGAHRWNALLLEVARSQSRTAFESLFEHFAPLVKAYAFKVSDLAQAEALAEEMVQETMIKIWRKAHTFDPDKSSASTWIFTIARNTRIDLIRKSARHWELNEEDFDEQTLDADDLWPEQTDDIPMAIETELNSQRISSAMQDLPLEQLGVIQLIFLEGLTHTEAALKLNLPLGTVKSRVRLALQKLKMSIDI